MGIKKKHTPGCGCCGECDCAECVNCATAVPCHVQLIVTDMADGTCADCNPTANGTFILTCLPSSSPDSCQWLSEPFTLCGVEYIYSLRMGTTFNYLVLQENDASPTIINEWFLTPEDDDCAGWSGLSLPFFANTTAVCNATSSTATVTSL